jgi:hypothetical protein
MSHEICLDGIPPVRHSALSPLPQASRGDVIGHRGLMDVESWCAISVHVRASGPAGA